jgi:protein-disulfide isomerase
MSLKFRQRRLICCTVSTSSAGLDVSQFLQDLSQQTHLDRINADIESGVRSGVTLAPALFINGIRYAGRWSKAQLTAAIVSESD